jgi:hypothetical protein
MSPLPFSPPFLRGAHNNAEQVQYIVYNGARPLRMVRHPDFPDDVGKWRLGLLHELPRSNAD